MDLLHDEPRELDSHPIPKDYDDEFIDAGGADVETRKRLRRIVKVFVTLSPEEQELITQEIEIG
jgi:hypothetical protein